MKRCIKTCDDSYVKSSRTVYDKNIKASEADNYSDYQKIYYGRHEFSCHITDPDENLPDNEITQIFKASLREIHPYDDAEYYWAKIENLYIHYIYRGKVVDKERYDFYDSEEFESVFEWENVVLEDAMRGLIERNKNIEPRILHD